MLAAQLGVTKFAKQPEAELQAKVQYPSRETYVLLMRLVVLRYASALLR